MKYKPGIIMQARVGSSRFPEKIILPFYNGKSILELLIGRFNSKSEYSLVVATTNEPADDLIFNICEGLGVDCFRGSTNNVLDRFYKASSRYKIDPIIRVCSDNPFLIESSPIELLNLFARNGGDYIGYRLSDKRVGIRTHFGLWAELFTRSAVERTLDSTEEKIYLEHVTNYLYTKPHKFNISYIDAPGIVFSRYNIRLTVDSEADFDLAKEIYSCIKEMSSTGKLTDLIRLIDSRPGWKERMTKSIMQNEK